MLRATVIVLTLASGTALAAESPRAFLELFTSQGCAACPSADRLLGELALEDEFIAVTMPTRLWDYLGWADTLASDLLTRRQLAYSVALGDEVYTPQLVVNGTTAVVGSNREAIAAAVEASANDTLELPIALEVRDGVLTVDVGDADVDVEEATLWLLVTENVMRVPVGRGENRGRRLTYYNVVRAMRPIGMWKGEPMVLDLPLSDLEKAAGAGCVVIAQVETSEGPGRVLGAAQLAQLFPARAALGRPGRAAD